MNLKQFTGTTSYYRFSVLFPNIFLTDGANYLAQEAEAYWLMETIASYQSHPKIKKCPMCQGIQFWELKVSEHQGILRCYRDTNDLVLSQKIPYTNFPLEQIKLYCQKGGDYWVIMLPTEY